MRVDAQAVWTLPENVASATDLGTADKRGDNTRL